MEYYEARDDMQLTDSWLLSDLNSGGHEVLMWDCSNGTPVNWTGSLSVKVVKKGRALDLNFNTWKTMIVSARARDVLERWEPDAVQYFPAEVPGASQPYFVANIVTLVDCLDERLSHVERFKENDPVRPDRAGEISLVIDLHIDPTRAEGRHLFRLKGYVGATIVSEELKRALEAAGLTGFKYDHVTSPTIAEFRVKFAERQRRQAAGG